MIGESEENSTTAAGIVKTGTENAEYLSASGMRN